MREWFDFSELLDAFDFDLTMFGKSGLLGLGASHCKIDLSFKSDGTQSLKTATIRVRGDDPEAKEELPLYKANDTVKGEVSFPKFIRYFKISV